MFDALETRPTTYTVRDLIQRVQQGGTRIPQFQRPLRWKNRDVCAFFDSIWRGYPVGSMLFWERPAPAERIVVGVAELDVPAVDQALWVVDGQQRLTALAATLLDLDQKNDARWRIAFDPAAAESPFGLLPLRGAGSVVPLSVLGDLRRLGRWLTESTLDEEAQDRVEEAQQRILDYALPAYVVRTDDERPLREIFARLNSSGARMRAEEVFTALVGSKAGPSDDTVDLDLLQGTCDREGFGQPARADVLKAVLAMSGRNPTRQIRTGPSDLEGLVPHQEAAEALGLTVDFIREDVGIPLVRLVPYKTVFVILARWFHLFGDVTDRETRTMLARWVWRGAATGAHRRDAVSKMRQQVEDVRDDAQDSLERLLAHTTAPGDDASWTVDKTPQNSAKACIEMLALLDAGPLDANGPVSPVGLASTGRFAQEILPRHLKPTLPDAAQRLVGSTANRILLEDHEDGPASAQVAELLQAPDERSEKILRSHLIDPVAAEALRNQEHQQFLQLRGAALAQRVADLLSRRAAWSDPFVRPKQHYFEGFSE